MTHKQIAGAALMVAPVGTFIFTNLTNKGRFELDIVLTAVGTIMFIAGVVILATEKPA